MLTKEQAENYANRLDDLNTQELSDLDEYYNANDSETDLPEGEEEDKGQQQTDTQTGDQQQNQDADTPQSGAQALDKLSDTEKNRRKFEGKQAYELGQLRKEKEKLTGELNQLRDKLQDQGTKAEIKDDDGETVDLTDPEQIKKFVDDQVKSKVETTLEAREKQNAELQKQRELETQQYQKGLKNLTDAQAAYPEFKTKEPIDKIFEKLDKGLMVDPEDAKVAQRLSSLHDYGMERGINSLKYAYRIFKEENGIKDVQQKDVQARKDLLDNIDEQSNSHKTLTDVESNQGKGQLGMNDLEKNKNFDQIIDNMPYDQLKKLESEIYSDPKYSLLGS